MEFIIVGLLVYSLTKNVYESYKVDKYIEQFQEENDRIEAENRQKSEDYLYFTSEEYIDKIAKQNLGLINPGEEVIVLSDQVLNEEVDGSSSDNVITTKYDTMSNSEKWWEFFFGD